MTVTVISVNPLKMQLYSGPLGHFSLEGRGSKRFSSLEIKPMRQGLDNGFGAAPRYLEVDPEEFARSAIAGADLTSRGVFVGAPTEEALRAAEQELRRHNMAQIRLGDEFAQLQQFRSITPEMRQAVIALGERRAWADADAYAQKEPCPLCTTLISPAAVVCPNCKRDIPGKSVPAAVAAPPAPAGKQARL